MISLLQSITIQSVLFSSPTMEISVIRRDIRKAKFKVQQIYPNKTTIFEISFCVYVNLSDKITENQ